MSDIRKIKIPYHPCMDEGAHSKIARLHLPVAKKCNIKCGYCERKIDHNIQRPGTCSSVISPSEALFEAKEFIKEWGDSSIIGIAGPGDPLYNVETFETIKLLNEHVPNIRICLCTNGLKLYESIGFLVEAKVKHVSITINGIDAGIVKKIHPFIHSDGFKIVGKKAAEILITNQLKAIESAVSNGIFIKINSVVIPGLNDFHLMDVAKKVSEIGAGIMNPMPLIPAGKFRDIKRPTSNFMDSIYNGCGKYIEVFKKCRQCRADARGIPGKENCRWKKTA
ncbi:MAG: radical SAM protein [Desulfobacterales bacterium]|nr:radical SAM protein [Desulfobacterales bacterium]